MTLEENLSKGLNQLKQKHNLKPFMLLQVLIQMKMNLNHMKMVALFYWIGSENKHQFRNILHITFYILHKINLYLLNIIYYSIYLLHILFFHYNAFIKF